MSLRLRLWPVRQPISRHLPAYWTSRHHLSPEAATGIDDRGAPGEMGGMTADMMQATPPAAMGGMG